MAQRPPRRTSPTELMDVFNAVLPDDLMTMIAQTMADHVDEEMMLTQEDAEQLLNGSGREQTNVGMINLPEDIATRRITVRNPEDAPAPPEAFPIGIDLEGMMNIPGFTDEQRAAFIDAHNEAEKAKADKGKNKRVKIRRASGEDLYAVGFKKGYEGGRKAGHERGYKEGQDVERRGRYVESEEVRMGTADDITEETAIPINRHHSAAPRHLQDNRNPVRDVTCHVENQRHRRAYLVSVEYPYYQDPGSRPERKYVTAEIPQGLIQDAVVGSTGIVQSLMPVAHRMYDTLTISMSGLEALSHTRAIMSVVLQTVTNQAAVSHRLSPEAIGSLYDLMYAVGQSKGFQVEDIELALHSQG